MQVLPKHVSKIRLVKMNLTTPQFELTASKMLSNLAQSIKNALNNENVRNFDASSDTEVVLHWLKYRGEYKIFVSNRVANIGEHSYN